MTAEEILLAAGVPAELIVISGSHPNWLVRVKGFGVSATDAGDESMDTPEECAAALVRAMGGVYGGGKREQIPAHETDSETVPEGGVEATPAMGEGRGGANDSVRYEEAAVSERQEEAPPQDRVGNLNEVPEPVREEIGDANPEAAPGPVDLGADAITDSGDGSVADGASGGGGDLLAPSRPEGAGDSDEDIFDAEYADIPEDVERLALAPPEEPALEGADFDQLFLPEPDPADFVPDESKRVADAVAMFGDNLPMQRLVLIGRVTQIAAELKAVLQEGWTVGEFSELQNHIMRISQGLAPDDEHVRARFGALSEASRAMNAIDAHAEAQVAYLEAATREQIEAYQPEEGWP